VQDRPYDVRGCSALVHASNIALHRMVKLLLDKGANSELTTAANCNRTAQKTDNAERTSLILAIDAKHLFTEARVDARHFRAGVATSARAVLVRLISESPCHDFLVFHSPVLSLPAPPPPPSPPPSSPHFLFPVSIPFPLPLPPSPPITFLADKSVSQSLSRTRIPSCVHERSTVSLSALQPKKFSKPTMPCPCLLLM